MAEQAPLVAVLAAGLATRFGGGKLDADCAGEPLGQWAIDAVAQAGLAPGVIVTGPKPPAFVKHVAAWQLLTNPAPEAGLGASVAMACREAEARGLGVLLVLADMPLVSPHHLNQLAACRSSAATRHPDGRAGVPVHLAAGAVGKFTSLAGDSGAGRLLSQVDGLDVLAAPTGTLLDVDDAESLEVARRQLAAR